jgi:hypothetical protein
LVDLAQLDVAGVGTAGEDHLVERDLLLGSAVEFEVPSLVDGPERSVFGLLERLHHGLTVLCLHLQGLVYASIRGCLDTLTAVDAFNPSDYLQLFEVDRLRHGELVLGAEGVVEVQVLKLMLILEDVGSDVGVVSLVLA